KQSIMIDKYPIAGPICLGEIYLRNLHDPSPCVLYPLTMLRSNASRAFLKTDTHMTEEGNLLIAKEILGRLVGGKHEDAIYDLLSSITEESDWIGDLGGRFDPPIKEVRKVLKRKSGIKWYHNNVSGGNNGIIDIIFRNEPYYQKRLLVFGD